MKIIVVGAGEVGMHIASQLIDEGKDVVIIEKSGDVARKASSTLDCLVIQGEATHYDVLKSAGVEGANVFISATTSDEVNLISCFIVGSEFNVPIKIARVRSAEYYRNKSFKSKISGVDYLVNTDFEAAWELFQIIEQGASGTIAMFQSTDIQLRGYYVESESFFKDKNVQTIRKELGVDFIVAGIVRGGELMIPFGADVVREEDTIYVAATSKIFYKISKKVGSKTDKIRKIVIVGGTAIGITLGDLLSSKGRSVVIIDKDYDVCRHIAEELPNVFVINGDVSDNKLYEEEQIDDMDAIVATTQNEELNIITGVYAKKIGVKKALAVVDKTSYLSLANEIGIDSTVSTKYCAINSILKFIRKGNIRSIHSIFEGQAEAIDVTIQPNSTIINTPIKDIKLPENCLVIAINRKRKSIIPNGDMELKVGDIVIFFALRTVIPELEHLLV